MNKISARDIQLFVAGALAIMGFRALIWIPYYVVEARYVLIVPAFVTGLTLPIGIGIFLRQPNAMLWAQIYLWMNVGAGMILLPFYWLTFPFPGKASLVTPGVVPGLLTNLVLVTLIFWSGSRKLADESRGGLS